MTKIEAKQLRIKASKNGKMEALPVVYNNEKALVKDILDIQGKEFYKKLVVQKLVTDTGENSVTKWTKVAEFNYDSKINNVEYDSESVAEAGSAHEIADRENIESSERLSGNIEKNEAKVVITDIIKQSLCPRDSHKTLLTLPVIASRNGIEVRRSKQFFYIYNGDEFYQAENNEDTRLVISKLYEQEQEKQASKLFPRDLTCNKEVAEINDIKNTQPDNTANENDGNSIDNHGNSFARFIFFIVMVSVVIAAIVAIPSFMDGYNSQR